MNWASFIAGLAFSNWGLGLVHSMAHQLGSEYDLPHGVANAMLLPVVEAFTAEVCLEKFRNIAIALGRKIENLSVEEASQEAIKALQEMVERLQIPKLAKIAFNPADADRLAEQAYADVCKGGNPRNVTVNHIKSLYKKAYEVAALELA